MEAQHHPWVSRWARSTGSFAAHSLIQASDHYIGSCKNGPLSFILGEKISFLFRSHSVPWYFFYPIHFEILPIIKQKSILNVKIFLSWSFLVFLLHYWPALKYSKLHRSGGLCKNLPRLRKDLPCPPRWTVCVVATRFLHRKVEELSLSAVSTGLVTSGEWL